MVASFKVIYGLILLWNKVLMPFSFEFGIEYLRWTQCHALVSL